MDIIASLTDVPEPGERPLSLLPPTQPVRPNITHQSDGSMIRRSLYSAQRHSRQPTIDHHVFVAGGALSSWSSSQSRWLTSLAHGTPSTSAFVSSPASLGVDGEQMQRGSVGVDDDRPPFGGCSIRGSLFVVLCRAVVFFQRRLLCDVVVSVMMLSFCEDSRRLTSPLRQSASALSALLHATSSSLAGHCQCHRHCTGSYSRNVGNSLSLF